MLDSARCIFARPLPPIKVIAIRTLVTAISTSITAHLTMSQVTVMTDLVPFNCLGLKALDFGHCQVDEGTADYDHSEPGECATGVFPSEFLTAFLLAIADYNVDSLAFELVQFDHLIDIHDDFEDDIHKHHQLSHHGNGLYSV